MASRVIYPKTRIFKNETEDEIISYSPEVAKKYRYAADALGISIAECISLTKKTGQHGVTCAAKGCDKNCRNSPGISFFRFPVKDTDRCNEWLIRCGRPELLGLTDLNNYRVCGVHFEPSQFFNSQKCNRLIWSARPSLFEPHEGSDYGDILIEPLEMCAVDESPFTGDVNHDYILEDEAKEHNYSVQPIATSTASYPYCVSTEYIPVTTMQIPSTCKNRCTQTHNPVMCNARTQTTQKTHCLVKRISNLNRLLNQRRSQVSFLKRKLEREIEKSNVISRKKIIEGSDQYLSENEHIFVKLMLGHSQKDTNYTPEEKNYLIKFYVHSRAMYKFLQQEFRSLPCMSTMNKWLRMNPELLYAYQLKKKRQMKRKLAAKAATTVDSFGNPIPNVKKRKRQQSVVAAMETDEGEVTELIFKEDGTCIFEACTMPKLTSEKKTMDAISSILPNGTVTLPIQMSQFTGDAGNIQHLVTQTVTLEDGNLAFAIPGEYEIVLAS